MPQYPMPFRVETQAAPTTQATWTVRSESQQAQCGVPKEFGGGGQGWSPEDLYAQALLNCFVGTFQVLAQNSKLTFQELQADAVLEVDLDESKKPIMKRCRIQAHIQGPSNPERAELLAKKAFQSGFILNSVKTELQFECRIS